VIAIIPARSGSKGLPGKNIKPLLGKPLIAYTIEAALKSKHITNIIVSTNDKNIYQIGLNYGADDTFLRPAELAQDDSLAIDNYLYTIQRLNDEFNYDINDFVVLQPTSPLRKSEDIDAAIELFRDKSADSVISYTEEHHPISWHKYIDEAGRVETIFPESIQNRQVNRPTYYPNGAVYVFSLELIKLKKYYSEKSFAYLMPRERSIDIDTADDFNYAEFIMRNKR
jgi:N-acylneuraminate cytidylyltransferase/CMP-N,N'-diacetyllegionaminic acid synthase